MDDPRIDGIQPTLVTYPAGSLREDASVLLTLADHRPDSGPRRLVVTDVTPFHPLDPLWPDQPADHGRLLVDGQAFAVTDTVTLAQRAGGPMMVGEEIDARRDEPGVLFLVAHAVDETAAPLPAPGTRVVLQVDAGRRARLSAAHTACHLLAYALNEATHGLWRKPTRTDSRGHHDLDEAACVLTRHDEGGSLDRYRLGKSLRRSGFDSVRFLEELPAVMEAVNGTLAKWISEDAPVRLECDGPLLTDRRHWFCETPGGTAHMPCGGTHVSRLGEMESMTAVATHDSEQGVLTIRNEVRVKGD